MGFDPSAEVIADRLDAAISHIYKAGVLIQTGGDTTRPASGSALDSATDELVKAIHLLQAEALGNTADALTTLTTEVARWAWSAQEVRWVGLTFCELQVWLDHPHLDPLSFASHEAAS